MVVWTVVADGGVMWSADTWQHEVECDSAVGGKV